MSVRGDFKQGCLIWIVILALFALAIPFLPPWLFERGTPDLDEPDPPIYRGR